VKKQLAALVVVTLLPVAWFYLHPHLTEAEDLTPQVNEALEASQPIHTQSSFIEKFEEKTKVIPHRTIYKEDPEKEAGEDTIVQEGTDGVNKKTIRVLYFQGQEYSRETASEEAKPAQDKIIYRGTKVVWKELDTPQGKIRYWKKLHVYATHYDSHCPGCNEWTAIGMRQGKGVIAVDPAVIKMRSKVYIPSYGEAIAGDTGGAIQGNIIDLGFEDAKTAGWSAHYVDIYLIDKAPS
jgi:3D (Asp-Asp-Asp) domain-containing protein